MSTKDKFCVFQTFMGEKILYRLCHGFRSSYFPETSFLSPSTHAQKTMQVGCDRSVMIDTLLGEKSPFHLCFGLHSRSCHATSRLAFSTHGLRIR
jgi:hypothetical protein